MSKLKFFLFLVLCSGSELTFAANFDGFYAGLMAGGTKLDVSTQQESSANVVFGGVTITDINLDNSPHLSDSSSVGALDLGFSKVLPHHFYLGLDLMGQLEDLHDKSNGGVFPTPITDITYDHEYEMSLHKEVALSLKPGYLIGDNTLFFAKLGLAWGDFHSKGSLNYNQSTFGGGIVINGYTEDSSSSWETGLRLGLGIEHYFTPAWSFSLEYFNTSYGTVDSGKPHNTPIAFNGDTSILTGSGLTDSDKTKISNNTVLFGFTYHFNA